MDCERVREEFVERLTGSLDAERSRVLDDHIGGCAACRAETDRMRELWTELGTLNVAPSTGSASRVERLIGARSRQANVTGVSSARAWTGPRAAISATALAATLFVGVLLGRGVRSSSPEPTTTAAPTVVTTPAKEKYILLLHGPARKIPTTVAEAAADSAAERALVAEYSAWAGQLAARGSLVGGEKLADEPLARLASNGMVAATPRFTADELGGFFIIQVADSTEAYRIARECPHLRHGGTVQLRRIEPT